MRMKQQKVPTTCRLLAFGQSIQDMEMPLLVVAIVLYRTSTSIWDNQHWFISRWLIDNKPGACIQWIHETDRNSIVSIGWQPLAFWDSILRWLTQRITRTLAHGSEFETAQSRSTRDTSLNIMTTRDSSLNLMTCHELNVPQLSLLSLQVLSWRRRTLFGTKTGCAIE